MSDFFSVAVEVQKEIIRAQEAQLDAAPAVLDAGAQAVAAQQAAQRVAEANAGAWVMWGWM